MDVETLIVYLFIHYIIYWFLSCVAVALTVSQKWTELTVLVLYLLHLSSLRYKTSNALEFTIQAVFLVRHLHLQSTEGALHSQLSLQQRSRRGMINSPE